MLEKLIVIVPGQINLNLENATLGIAALVVAYGIAVIIRWYATKR